MTQQINVNVMVRFTEPLEVRFSRDGHDSRVLHRIEARLEYAEGALRRIEELLSGGMTPETLEATRLWLRRHIGALRGVLPSPDTNT